MAIKLDFDNDPIAEINITPFVDIVLVLLIIFMVTAQFIVGQGLNLDLPSAKSSEIIQKQNHLTIFILKDTTYMLDGQSMTLDNIEDYIEENFPNKNLVSVTINADKSVPYDSLVRLMDTLRLRGVSNFALQMNPSSGAP